LRSPQGLLINCSHIKLKYQLYIYADIPGMILNSPVSVLIFNQVNLNTLQSQFETIKVGSKVLTLSYKPIQIVKGSHPGDWERN
jgi:hypothetical protein